MKKLLSASAVVAAVASSLPVFAVDPVTLPTTGVDVGSYATAGITTLGGVVAICVGGMIAFMLIRWGIKWVRGIGR